MMTRKFPRNAVVLNEGDTTDSMYAIIEGRVKVYLTNEEGKEITLNMKEAGDYFGELALLDDEPRSASVMTLSPTTLLVVTKETFRECLARNPDIALRLIRELTFKVRELTEDIRDFALKDVYGRIAKTLTHLSEETEDGARIVHERLTQRDIANMVGASREMVSRIFKELTAGGYISVDAKRITINRKLPAGW